MTDEKQAARNALKSRINTILHDVLRGYDPNPRYRTDGGHVRWGLVEKDMCDAIDEAFKESAP